MSIEKSQSYANILALATNVVTGFTTSSSRSNLLFQRTGKRLVRPVRTRWLFAYYMLRRLIEVRSHIDAIIEEEQMDVGLSPNQWRQAEMLCAFLKDFADEVTELEGEKYVTVNRVIPSLMCLLQHCQDFEKKQGFVQIASAVSLELRRRFSIVLNSSDAKFQPIYAVSTLLDPSVRSLLSLNDYPLLLKSAKLEALRLMRQSNPAHGSGEESSQSPEPEPSPSSTNKFQRLFSKLAEQEDQQKRTVNVCTAAEYELDGYLRMETAGIGDPIAFWLSHEHSMPQMYALALDLFSVTATSAPIERVFSHAGIATHGRRNRLDAESLNAELLMKLNHFLFD